MNKQITIQITTRNRLAELQFTLGNIGPIINNPLVHTIICVDGSNDKSFEFIQTNYPNIELIYNNNTKGLIASRNRMMALTQTPYAISLDDDAHFLTENPIDKILSYFEVNPNCAVMAFRIYWGLNGASYSHSGIKPYRVKDFVGCGHAWRMEAWNKIKPYPEWFVFYGEEAFASYELFRQNLEIHFTPEIFIQHRVDINARKKNKDYLQRNRRAIRSGWYLWLMFVPWKYIPKYWGSSVYTQIKKKVLRGDFYVLLGLLLALIDIFINIPHLYRSSNRLSDISFKSYLSLPETTIYWNTDRI